MVYVYMALEMTCNGEVKSLIAWISGDTSEIKQELVEIAHSTCPPPRNISKTQSFCFGLQY